MIEIQKRERCPFSCLWRRKAKTKPNEYGSWPARPAPAWYNKGDFMPPGEWEPNDLVDRISDLGLALHEI